MLRPEILHHWFVHNPGAMTRLAARLGISVQAVSAWRQVPAARCLEVESVTGISRHVLRPDIYGPPQDETQAA